MNATSVDEVTQDLLQKLIIHTKKREEQDFKHKGQELITIAERLKQIAQELATITDEHLKIEEHYLSKTTNDSPSRQIKHDNEDLQIGHPVLKPRKKSFLRETIDFIAKR